MLFALALLLCVASLGQVCIQDMYTIMAVANNERMSGSDSSMAAQRGMRVAGVAGLLSFLGIWAIKLNFLLFFRRLVVKITKYMILWWAVLIITIACGAITISLTQFHCTFGPMDYIMTTCLQPSTLKRANTFYLVSCIVDVVSDLLSELISTRRCQCMKN